MIKDHIFYPFFKKKSKQKSIPLSHIKLYCQMVTILAFHWDLQNTSQKSIHKLSQFWNSSVLKGYVSFMHSNILFSFIFQCAYQTWIRNKVPLLKFLVCSGLCVYTQNKAGRLRTAVIPCFTFVKIGLYCNVRARNY